MPLLTRSIVGGLFALNALLGIGLYSRLGGDKTAYAQIGGNKSYVAVAGYSNSDTVLYVLEPTTGRLVAIRTSIVDRKVTLAAARNIAQDFARTR